MVNRLYLDGCSLTYGQGLPRDQSLGSLYQTIGGYAVKDNSRPGKSNMSIVFDTYQNFQDYDVFVLGFTFSSRFGIKYHDQNLDFYGGHHGKGFGLDSKSLDLAQLEVYKYFYTVFGHPYCDQLSNMLVDSLIAFLLKENKQVVPFSWEQRKVTSKIHYPYVKPSDRLPDGHLNQQGTVKLFDFLGDCIGQ